MTLIVVALARQVVIGILAIFITHTKKTYKKYRTGVCSEWMDYLCRCCSCLDNTRPSPGSDNHVLDVSPMVVGKDSVDIDLAGDAFWATVMMEKNGIDDDDIYDVHKAWSLRLMQLEMEDIKAEIELVRLEEQLVKETKRSETRIEDDPNDIRPEPEQVEASANKDDSRESGNSVLNINKEILECKATRRRFHILGHQVNLLSEAADNVQLKCIQKRVVCWQNIINYLLYIVFVCNAFITGMGVKVSKCD